MNNFTGIGRLASDPDVRYTQTANGDMTIVRFNLATDRRSKREGQPTADFHSCVAFGRTADFIAKWFSKGNRIALDGTVQNNNYEKDGVKHYGYQIVVNNVEFCESINNATNAKESNTVPSDASNDGFMDIPDDVEDGGLPFN